jgi:non-specific serine/threonine protein kinase
MMLAPVLTPHGLLMLAQSLEAEGEAPALEPEHALRLEKAFARGAGHGLVLLGADEVGTTGPMLAVAGDTLRLALDEVAAARELAQRA